MQGSGWSEGDKDMAHNSQSSVSQKMFIKSFLFTFCEFPNYAFELCFVNSILSLYRAKTK